MLTRTDTDKIAWYGKKIQHICFFSLKISPHFLASFPLHSEYIEIRDSMKLHLRFKLTYPYSHTEFKKPPRIRFYFILFLSESHLLHCSLNSLKDALFKIFLLFALRGDFPPVPPFLHLPETGQKFHPDKMRKEKVPFEIKF